MKSGTNACGISANALASASRGPSSSGSASSACSGEGLPGPDAHHQRDRQAGQSPDDGLEQLADHPERELGLQLTAPRREHLHPGVGGQAPGLLQQRGLADARGALRQQHRGIAAARAPDQVADRLQLALAFEKEVRRGGHPPHPIATEPGGAAERSRGLP
jgi:hypothetical protein